MKDKTFKTGIGDKAAVPIIDGTTCNLCGLCIKVCGTGLIIKDGAVTFDPNAFAGCMGCGQCMAICPTGSITVVGRKMSPEMLLPMPSKEGSATPDQLESLLMRRRSMRNFSEKEVEKEVVDRIIRIASTAPMGLPPSDVEVIAFTGRKKIRVLNKEMMGFFKSMSKYYLNPILLPLMRPFMKKANYEMIRDFVKPVVKAYIDSDAKGIDVLFYDCPLLLLFHAGPYSDPADSYIAATYAMVAAESMDLGCCINGMIGPILSYDKKLMRRYGIPKQNKVTIGLMIGYPAVKYQHTIRREFASVSYLS